MTSIDKSSVRDEAERLRDELEGFEGADPHVRNEINQILVPLVNLEYLGDGEIASMLPMLKERAHCVMNGMIHHLRFDLCT